MAGRKTKPYESKAITTKIQFTSRAAVNIGKNFYTVEACEERMIPDLKDVDLDKEKELLWNEVNRQVDMQIDDIWAEFEKEDSRNR